MYVIMSSTYWSQQKYEEFEPKYMRSWEQKVLADHLVNRYVTWFCPYPDPYRDDWFE